MPSSHHDGTNVWKNSEKKIKKIAHDGKEGKDARQKTESIATSLEKEERN